MNAEEAAVLAADAAGVVLREVSTLADIDAIVRLYGDLWGREKNPPVTVELLRAFAKAGNYIGGAFDGDELLGACVGFFAAPPEESLHSHIAGVSRAARGRNVGFALKLHQRAWAMERNVPVISWTFDPLVSRNAHFNVAKLQAQPREYLPDFYGDMADQINGRDASDRLLVRWRLDAPAVVAACAGEAPVADARAERERGAVVVLGADAAGAPETGPAEGAVQLVAVPTDIERMRVEDPALAGRWRAALRDVLSGLMADGAEVTGYDRTGWYILRKGEA
jgi:predicted GNAT superfamily acetyltransferase